VVVMIAIGTTDLIFALDSIPAIFGLTKAAYLVFTANVFALLGLRQLYFLIGGLLQRLVYLSRGLAAVLGFIGIKLILEALHDSEEKFLNGFDAIPMIPTWLSLLVIVAILGIATLTSLLHAEHPADAAAAREQRAEVDAPPPRQSVRYRPPDGEPPVSWAERRAEHAGSGRTGHGRWPQH
jgi:predicted tellurium resistance membrane protein TerC